MTTKQNNLFNEDRYLKSVIDNFMHSISEGVCPKCGSDDSDCAGSGDEGGAQDHFLQHDYRCLKCGYEWSKVFKCVPEYITEY